MTDPATPLVAGAQPAEAAGPSPVASMAAPAPAPTAKGAQAIKNKVVSESQTIGGVIEELDSYAINVGHTHVSAWSALVVVFVVAALIILARFAGRVAKRLIRRTTGLDPVQKVLTEKLVSIGVWVAAFFIGIDALGINLTALTVFSGAFGLAIGFGLQKTFGNLIAGIILLMDRSIKPGDVIALNDGTGTTFGQVSRIGIRAVSVVTRDRKEYLIPNENLMISQVENWSYSSREVRVKVPVGVSYRSDMALVEKLMLRAADESPRVLAFPKPVVLMVGYGESSVDFEIRIWITDPEDGVSNVRSEVLKRLWWLFKENGVEIPFPQRDLHIREWPAGAGAAADES